MRHTGALILWYNQRATVVGTYDQCKSELLRAQTHNLTLGWWSVLSVLLINWIALLSNVGAIKRLDSDQEQAAAYALWWYTHIAPRL